MCLITSMHLAPSISQARTKRLIICHVIEGYTLYNAQTTLTRVLSPWHSRLFGHAGGTFNQYNEACGKHSLLRSATPTVLCPGDMPIVLTQDGPSFGGFVCPCTVTSTELWKIGQLSPNDRVRFKLVSLGEITVLVDSLLGLTLGIVHCRNAPALRLSLFWIMNFKSCMPCVHQQW